MSAKPTELRKLIALLEGEADDVEELAKWVFKLVEDCLADREQYVIFAVHPTLFNLVQAVGPYATKNQAEKDYTKRISAYDSNSYARIALLRNPDKIISD
jgi:hypothetical protein